MNMDCDKYALLFKALSDSNRLLIIDYLLGGEKCACKILEQLQITQPTLSHHMKILCENDIVKARKDGKWMHYSLNQSKIIELMDLLSYFSEEKINQSPDCSC